MRRLELPVLGAGGLRTIPCLRHAVRVPRWYDQHKKGKVNTQKNNLHHSFVTDTGKKTLTPGDEAVL